MDGLKLPMLKAIYGESRYIYIKREDARSPPLTK